MAEVALGAGFAITVGIVAFVLCVVGVFVRHMRLRAWAILAAIVIAAYLMI